MTKGFNKLVAILLRAFIIAAAVTACTKDPLPSAERYTGDSYGNLHSPLVKDEMSREHQTRWSSLYFGSYPANEVVSGTFDAVDDYALEKGDVITDAALFDRLEKAVWDDNDDTVIDGRRYHRIDAGGAVTASGERAQHYRWRDLSAPHYFAYAPIRWRVLEISGSKALLLAHRMVDNCPYHTGPEDVFWSGSYLRKWLNSTFLDCAFSPSEQQAIGEVNIENADNHYFGTPCGPGTSDRIFILSENQVFASEKAVDYGFYPGDGLTDPARRFRSTLYAKCRGSWWSPLNPSSGCSFWFLRTNGYTPANAVYVGAGGDIYNRGMPNTCNDAAVLPAMVLDLSRAEYSVAPEVSSAL